MKAAQDAQACKERARAENMLVPLYQLIALPHLQRPKQGHISESSKEIENTTRTL